MAYIGRIPQVGNYFTLDAITTSSTATYNLLKDGVAYVPETAYHLIVSLNGVIQAPITAYTVSGSTIIFASSLSGTDSIDFITVLGDTLAIGTPSDGTVTNAKIVDMAATKLTGSIADARIPASAVTQHVTPYIAWDSSVKTGDFTAVAGKGYFVNTTSGEIDVTLPSSPSAGDVVAVKDYAKTFDSNNCILLRNSSKIGGTTSNAILSTEGIGVTLIFIDSTQGWLVTDSGLTSEAPTTKSVTFKLWGAGGGSASGGTDGGPGGGGGFVTGTVNVNVGTTIYAVVGQGGPGGLSGRGGSGGGYSGVFTSSVAQGNALLIAGGAGGGSRGSSTYGSYGGAGGGTTGGSGQASAGSAPGGGTQSAGGAVGSGGSNGNAGAALQGGSNTEHASGGTAFGGGGSGGGDASSFTAGGGGGGYFGGGSGGDLSEWVASERASGGDGARVW